MNINKVIDMLNTFAAEQGVPEGARSLLQTMVSNNVSSEGAETFCQEHYMTSDIADLYKQFFTYVLAKKAEETRSKSTKEEPVKTEVVGDHTFVKLWQETNSLLKELVDTIKAV